MWVVRGQLLYPHRHFPSPKQAERKGSNYGTFQFSFTNSKCHHQLRKPALHLRTLQPCHGRDSPNRSEYLYQLPLIILWVFNITLNLQWATTDGTSESICTPIIAAELQISGEDYRVRHVANEHSRRDRKCRLWGCIQYVSCQL